MLRADGTSWGQDTGNNDTHNTRLPRKPDMAAGAGALEVEAERESHGQRRQNHAERHLAASVGAYGLGRGLALAGCRTRSFGWRQEALCSPKLVETEICVCAAPWYSNLLGPCRRALGPAGPCCLQNSTCKGCKGPLTRRTSEVLSTGRNTGHLKAARLHLRQLEGHPHAYLYPVATRNT